MHPDKILFNEWGHPLSHWALLPTYQSIYFNVVLFAQNYLIKTLIDPIKLEHYPSMRRHFLIGPGDQGNNLAVQKTNRYKSKAEGEKVINCEIYCESFFNWLGLIHFLRIPLVIASFQKYIFLNWWGFVSCLHNKLVPQIFCPTLPFPTSSILNTFAIIHLFITMFEILLKSL